MTAPQEVNPNRRALVMLGAGLGVLVLIFILTRVVGGGDDDTDDTFAVPSTIPGTSPSSTIAPSPEPGTPGAAPVESFEVFNTKNPFVPLRGSAGAQSGTVGTGTPTGTVTPTGTGTATGTAGTGTTGGTTTGGTTTGGTTTGTTGSGTTGGSTEPRRNARVALLDIFSEGGKVVANVRVNDQVFKVSAGQQFGTNFQAVSLSQADDCGRFLFGDDQFRLCKGEELLK